MSTKTTISTSVKDFLKGFIIDLYKVYSKEDVFSEIGINSAAFRDFKEKFCDLSGISSQTLEKVMERGKKLEDADLTLNKRTLKKFYYSFSYMFEKLDSLITNKKDNVNEFIASFKETTPNYQSFEKVLFEANNNKNFLSNSYIEDKLQPAHFEFNFWLREKITERYLSENPSLNNDKRKFLDLPSINEWNETVGFSSDRSAKDFFQLRKDFNYAHLSIVSEYLIGSSNYEALIDKFVAEKNINSETAEPLYKRYKTYPPVVEHAPSGEQTSYERLNEDFGNFISTHNEKSKFSEEFRLNQNLNVVIEKNRKNNFEVSLYITDKDQHFELVKRNFNDDERLISYISRLDVLYQKDEAGLPLQRKIVEDNDDIENARLKLDAKRSYSKPDSTISYRRTISHSFLEPALEEVLNKNMIASVNKDHPYAGKNKPDENFYVKAEDVEQGRMFTIHVNQSLFVDFTLHNNYATVDFYLKHEMPEYKEQVPVEKPHFDYSWVGGPTFDQKEPEYMSPYHSKAFTGTSAKVLADGAIKYMSKMLDTIFANPEISDYDTKALLDAKIELQKAQKLL